MANVARHQGDLNAESKSTRQVWRVLIVEDDVEIARMLGE
ncbi:MAG: DNA-binding response regulator, partial [Mesorhizobium sp.]